MARIRSPVGGGDGVRENKREEEVNDIAGGLRRRRRGQG